MEDSGAPHTLGTAQREALSWAVAAQLARRHPDNTRISYGSLAAGHRRCLWVREPSLESDGGAVALDCAGSVRVHARFDHQTLPESATKELSWSRLLTRTGPVDVVRELEQMAGLTAPPASAPATAETLTWRILACFVAAACAAPAPLHVEPGHHDEGGLKGNSWHYDAFPTITPRLLSASPDDPHGIAGHRFWFITQHGIPQLAFEQSTATAWMRGDGGRGLNLRAAYGRHGRSPGLLSLVGALSAKAGLRLL